MTASLFIACSCEWNLAVAPTTSRGSCSAQKRAAHHNPQSNQTCRYKSVFSGRVQKYYHCRVDSTYSNKFKSLICLSEFFRCHVCTKRKSLSDRSFCSGVLMWPREVSMALAYILGPVQQLSVCSFATSSRPLTGLNQQIFDSNISWNFCSYVLVLICQIR